MKIHSRVFALFLAVECGTAFLTTTTTTNIKSPNSIASVLSPVPNNVQQQQQTKTSSVSSVLFMAATADQTTNLQSGDSNAYDQVDFQAYSKGYKTVFAELPFAECTASFGTIPKDLKGTYYKNGPAMFSAGSIMPPKTSIIQPRDGPPVPDGQNPNRMVQHPFDGDGGILAVTFNNGTIDGKEDGEPTVTARYRYVRTVAFTNERRKGQRLYRGMDSTRALGPEIGEGLGNDLHTPFFRHHLQPGLNKNRKNTSNTRTIYWGKRLLSLWEGGQPYKMDALALSTEGRSQLGGVLLEQDPFGCKMVIDPRKDRAVMYSVKQDLGKSEITIYEFNNKFRLVEEKGEEDGKRIQSLPGIAMISDMAVTQNYAIVVQPPVSAGMQFLLVKEPGKVLKVEKKPSMVHLIPRVGVNNKSFKSISIPFDGVVEADLQLINAYEDENNNNIVIFDAIRSDGINKKSSKGSSSSSSSSPPQWPWASTREEYEQNSAKRSLWRYMVDLKSETVSKELLSNHQCFFGVIPPHQSTKKHSQIYMALGGLGEETIAPPQGIGRLDTSTKQMKDIWMPTHNYEFCGEPMFAPKEKTTDSTDDNDTDVDGYILTVLFNGKDEQSELLIFESLNLSSGPITRIPLGIGIPHGLHGCFTNAEEATMWSGEEIERRAKLADKMESRGNLWNEVKSDFSGLGLRFDDMEEYFGDSFLS